MTEDLDAIRERLRTAGATDDEFAEMRSWEDAYQLSGDLGVRPAGEHLSLQMLADRAGVTVAHVQELFVTAGLSADDLDARRWYSSDVDWVRTADAARQLLGDEAVLALLRRGGGAMSQLANASSSVFRVNVITDVLASPIDVVERNLASGVLIETLIDALGQLFRYHALLSFREDSVAAGLYGEMRLMAVGFVDIASSTELGERVTGAELAALVADFDRAAFGIATRHGVRVVKTIGDEVMLCAVDASAVCRAAIALVEFCRIHEVFSAARAGVAAGDVLEQDGDCYGPVVNRAARFVGAAPDARSWSTTQ